MGPSIKIVDEALRAMLYEQMKHSVELKAEIAHFKRTPAAYNYDFLLMAMQRHIDDHRVEQNRKAQLQSYTVTQDPSALATTPKPKGASKLSTASTPMGGQNLPGYEVTTPLLLLPKWMSAR